MELCRQLAGVFVTFWQLLHSLWSSAVLTMSCRWIKPARTREWGWLHTNLLHFKQSRVQLFNQSLFHPITSSPLAMGEWRNNRCVYTGSRSHKPSHRQLWLYGRSLLTGEVMFNSRLSVWAALSRRALLTLAMWGTG